jgi:hypothetical protein
MESLWSPRSNEADSAAEPANTVRKCLLFEQNPADDVGDQPRRLEFLNASGR